MSSASIILLNDTGNELEVTGDKVPADGYYGSSDGLHTITIHLSNFTGRVYLEATLAADPKEEDWFYINLSGGKPYVQYPLSQLNPTGIHGDTGVDAYTFVGNFVYLRARIDKTYIVPAPSSDSEKALLGSITKILLNH